jgi:thiol-disulfide isomerase/thioredoxin
MKNLIVYSLVFFALFSCGENEAEKKKAEINFSIEGTIIDAENSTIYLEAFSEQGTISVAKTTLDANGHFKLEDNIPGLGIYQLRLGEAQDKVIPMTLAPHNHVKIASSFAEYELKPNASGTNWTKHLNFYTENLAIVLQKQKALSASNPGLSEAEMMTQYMEFRKPIDEYSIKVLENDPSNPFNIIFSTSLMPTTGFETWNPDYLFILEKVAVAFGEKYPGSPISATFDKQYQQIASAFQTYQVQNGGASNVNAPEIALKSTQGKTLKLSSLKGKVVLIDFWASWCKPCRMENPNVVKLYNKYKSKGFDIFSVSLDSDPNAWKQAIQSDGLVWPNHVSDLQGWKSSVCVPYQVQSIPHTVLVDKEGKIIATGLRGADLERKLQELLN